MNMMTNYKNINNMLIVFNQNKSDYKFIIDWSAKSGCTVICKMFFDYMELLDEYNKNSNWIHNSRSLYYEEYGRVNNKLLFSNEYLKIKFVRNPYSRAISSFIHVMKTKLKEKFNNKDMSFYNFLLNLQKKEINDIHYNLQIIKEEKNDNIFDKVIKIENLIDEVKLLNENYNINLNCDFSSFHHNNIGNTIKKYCGHTKYSEMKEIPNYKFFYNKKIKNLVYEIYKEDIHKYNYTFQDFLISCR